MAPFPAGLPVLVSPAAGAADPAAVVARIRAALPDTTPRFLHPASIAELRSAIDALVRDGAEAIAVAGGDGTLHHAVNALGDAPVTLAPVPVGSGNDFCRGIGLTDDPAAALTCLASGGTRRVDLLEVNGHRVCTVAGLGLVADTGVQTGRLLSPRSLVRRPVRALGQWAYLATASARLALVPHLAHAAHLTWQSGESASESRSGPCYGLFLANLPTLGAGLRLPVATRLDDGRFELAWLPVRSRLSLVRALASLRGSRPVPPGVLEVRSTGRASIDWPGGSALLADGEDLGTASLVTARALPGALRVPAPPG
jgi:diacylglycerol kinase (ATP)